MEKIQKQHASALPAEKASVAITARNLSFRYPLDKPPHVERLPKGLPRILCKYCFDQTIEDGFD